MRPVDERGYAGVVEGRRDSPLDIRHTPSPAYMAAASCNGSAKRMLNALTDAGNEAGALARAQGNENFRQAAEAYRRDCFGTIADLPEEWVKAGVGAIVGILEVDGTADCTAVRSADDRVITAAHCIYRGKPLGSARFHPLEDLSQAYTVQLPLERSKSAPLRRPEDQIELLLQGAPARLNSAVFSNPELGDQLFAVGLYAYARSENWRDDVAWAKGNTCKVTYVSRAGCIAHGCQTPPGFSGAPLMRLRNGTIEILGIHVGGATQLSGCLMPTEMVRAMGNLGITLRPNRNL